jgi:hypothetical protein
LFYFGFHEAYLPRIDVLRVLLPQRQFEGNAHQYRVADLLPLVTSRDIPRFSDKSGREATHLVAASDRAGGYPV